MFAGMGTAPTGQTCSHLRYNANAGVGQTGASRMPAGALPVDLLFG